MENEALLAGESESNEKDFSIPSWDHLCSH